MIAIDRTIIADGTIGVDSLACSIDSLTVANGAIDRNGITNRKRIDHSIADRIFDRQRGISRDSAITERPRRRLITRELRDGRTVPRRRVRRMRRLIVGLIVMR